MSSPTPSILLTGATGYVGGRLLRLFQEEGRAVRCLARSPERLADRITETTEVVEGDVLDPESLEGAFDGIRCAYYLIHALGAKKGFEEQELAGARHFADAAGRAGVERIIYLGGLGSEEETLSPHLHTRHEVGRILRESGATVLEFRASIILGSGSLSFEMIRALTEHLPFMITPRWVQVKAQPISIRNVLAYLTEAAELDLQGHEIFEIGGTEQLTYRELMEEFARRRGLKRVMIPVPVLTPRLSSLWLGLVTPVYARIGRKLIDSIEHPTVVTSDRAAKRFPDIEPVSAGEAIEQALQNEDRDFAETYWSDSLSSTGLQPSYGGVRYGSRLIDFRELEVAADPETCFAQLELLGGENGWPTCNILWRIRGAIDLLLGGVGMRRGRPDRPLRVGDPIDFWRVEKLERPRRLLLKAEMKVPGRAWLEFEVNPADAGSKLSQSAIFDPKGIFGLAYWYGIYPIHGLIFRLMVLNLKRRIEENTPEIRTN